MSDCITLRISKMLYEYTNNKKYIQHRLEYLRNLHNVSPSDFQRDSVQGGAMDSAIERTIDSILDDEILNKLYLVTIPIDDATKQMSHDDSTLFFARFCSKLPWADVASCLHVAEITARSKRKNKLLNFIYAYVESYAKEYTNKTGKSVIIIP